MPRMVRPLPAEVLERREYVAAGRRLPADPERRMAGCRSLLRLKAVVRSGLRRCSMSSTNRRAATQSGSLTCRAPSRSGKGA